MLRKVYDEYLSALGNSLKGIDPSRLQLSNPLLIDVPDSYLSSPVKLMIVGQQTFGWWGCFGQGLGNDPVATLLSRYRDFNLGKDYVRSPFWRVAHKLAKGINATGDCAFVWNNLVKVDQGGKRPDPILEDLICGCYPILESEIKILKPDIIVFFTGPYYDSRIQATFSEVQFADVDGFEVRKLSRLIHQCLPGAPPRPGCRGHRK
ncbi:MAG: hypothetical protein QME76_06440 [Bacillota bacterium]|nr:hypothetical protein [Bacillota bacterium]